MFTKTTYLRGQARFRVDARSTACYVLSYQSPLRAHLLRTPCHFVNNSHTIAPATAPVLRTPKYPSLTEKTRVLSQKSALGKALALSRAGSASGKKGGK